MGGANYYILTALPALPSMMEPAPIHAAEFRQRVAETSSHAAELVDLVLLSDDLLQRQGVLAGEIEKPEPTVLSVEQITDELPLPDFLIAEADAGRAVAIDAAWEAYYQHLHAVAQARAGEFLAEYAAYEVGLRNALAEHRAKDLGLAPEGYYVAESLGRSPSEYTTVINEWSAAANPMEAQKVLDRARWNWLEANDAWFSFSNDELAAYAAKLMLSQRWDRLTRQAGQDAHSAPAEQQ
jgi:hypothetical protein